MSKIRIAPRFILVGLLFALTGCTSFMQDHTPDEWLSLSVAGLASTDRYAFSGQTTVSTAEGWTFTPLNFNGKVVDHEQLAAKADDGSTLEWSPVELLQQIKKNDKQVSFSPISSGSTDTNSVILQINMNDATSSEIWKTRLTEEMNQLADNAPLSEGSLKQEWMKEWNQSRQELSDMLKKLKVTTQYELVIDRKTLVPRKLNEQSVFVYTKGNQQREEKRITNMSFDSFDGRASNTVQ
ncbi:MAG: hypothetical protein ACE3L7_30895 [Candidatus Pristimantibacillus sp.]